MDVTGHDQMDHDDSDENAHGADSEWVATPELEATSKKLWQPVEAAKRKTKLGVS